MSFFKKIDKNFINKKMYHTLKFIGIHQGDKPKYIVQSDNYNYKLPKNMGYIYHITHDFNKKSKNIAKYNSENTHQVLSLLEKHKDYIGIMATSTVGLDNSGLLYVHQLLNEGKSIQADKFFQKNIGSKITNGHITIIYDNMALSHAPWYYDALIETGTEKSEVEIAIEKHVEKSSMEGQQLFSFVVFLHKDCFQSLDFRAEIKKHNLDKNNYELFGNDGKSNCAIMAQQVLLRTRSLVDMIPLATLNMIMFEAGSNFLKDNNDRQVLYEIIESTGINASLPEVTKREKDYALHIMPENNKETPKEENDKDEHTYNF